MPTWVWALAHAGLATVGVYHVLLYKRDPQSAMGWIMACIFIPYAGPIAYFLFGINRVRNRARGLRDRFSVGRETGRSPASNRMRAVPGGAPVDATLADGAERITGRAATTGNEVEALHDGDAAYPSMLQAIAGARQRVLLSSYIFAADRSGRAFIEALGDAVRRGVEVRVLIDGVGGLYSLRRAIPLLHRQGVPCARFLPPRLLPPSVYLNLRNHRKLLVVDDRIAFAGGMNLADAYCSAPERERTITDLHFRLRGGVVGELAELFLRDWTFVTGEVLAAPAAAAVQDAGDMRCRVVADGPDDDLDALALTIQTMVSAARSSVEIMTPYFLPSRELFGALQSAALRGVRVRVLLPVHNNLFYVHWANRNLLADLLASGVEISYQPPPFCHSKLLCIDDDYTLIGSANLDPRSLRLNFELGVEVMSQRLCAQMRTHFEAVFARSQRLDPAELAARSVPVRLRDSLAALLSPYL